MLRSTIHGLELLLPAEHLERSWSEIERRLAERPDFYRGTVAAVTFEGAPSAEHFAAVLTGLEGHGVALRGCYGDDAVAGLAAERGVPYLGDVPRATVTKFERKRASREAALTDRARSLDADFAGARADIARRRARGEPSVPRPAFGEAGAPAALAVEAPAAPAGPATLYHRGTLRGGQTLQQLGNVVVVGDVNPGAELIASGDIVVFGSLRGTAHAGAQGDAAARVFALELAPTQLRIATFIATGEGPRRGPAAQPEVAFVDGDRIAIAPARAEVLR